MSGTVSAGYAAQLIRFAVARGADPRALLEGTGIREEDLEDPDHRIALSAYVALMAVGKELCGAPALALHLGAACDLRELSVVGLICYAAATMGDALRELNRYGRLVMEVEVDVSVAAERFEIVTRGGELWLVDRRTSPNDFPELTESTWSRFIAETARHFPEAAFAKAVHVTHPAPAHAAEYAELWKVPVTFGGDWNAISIDPSWLTIDLHNPSRYAFGVLTRHADKLLEELASAKTARGRVESVLLPILHRGDVGMEPIAASLGVSRASLYRQLKEEGVTYEAVVDALRHRMAVYYLRGRKVSVNETAYLVGFSEPSAFSRAFKRWTGVRPRTVKGG
ncbi:MAG: AraC family transcriptional regulator [Deltaproteobacteria bacterium]|nr:AraC family transcriptional regulator [Deltaproteobacteria bacterium]